MTQNKIDFHRVERAIRFLEESRHRQPDLDAVAEHVGLSKYHFHRLFQRWAGTTPKRFLQHLTVEHARTLLEDSQPVLETAFRSGLSGGSRLHDHFVRVEAVTPGEVQRRGAGLEIRSGIHPSPFGDAFLAATDRGICFLAFLPSGAGSSPALDPSGEREEVEARARDDLRNLWPEASIIQSEEGTAELARRAFAVLEERPNGTSSGAGEGGALDHGTLPLHLRGTNFQLQVWRALLRIPPGRVASYGNLARLVGRPGAARAVGGAVAANPVSFLIPCHRVIRSAGGFGNYRWGSARKRVMLGWEAGLLGERAASG